MNFLHLLTAFYSSATLSLLLISMVPALKERLFPYGKTLDDRHRIDLVPKDWFIHFYFVGGCSSLVALMHKSKEHQPLVTLMFLIHCIRRFLECYFTKKSQSKMHILHYAMGIFYYLLTSWAWDILPSDNYFFGVLIWIFASCEQNWCHSYLKSLRTINHRYPLPKDRHFSNTACPHYFFEVCIYFGFVVLSRFHYVSIVILVWVIVDLHLAATQQWKWYQEHYKTPQEYNRWVPYFL